MCPASRRMGLVRIAAVLVALLVLGLGGAWAYTSLAVCTDEERAVFEEFLQYGGQEIEPEPESATGGCVVRFDTSDPQEEVFAYYSERLRENAWEVEREPPPYSEMTEPKGQPGEETVPATIRGVELFARRGAYVYRIHYLPQPRSEEGRVIASVE